MGRGREERHEEQVFVGRGETDFYKQKLSIFALSSGICSKMKPNTQEDSSLTHFGKRGGGGMESVRTCFLVNAKLVNEKLKVPRR